MSKSPTKVRDVPFSRRHPAYILASWFWWGRLYPASGFWGSLGAIPFWVALFLLGHLPLVLAGIAVLTILGSLAIEHIERHCGRENSHDASVFVVDEVVGMGITLLPVMWLLPNAWQAWALAFFFFRIFDVLKPFPANFIDKNLHNGWGVMLDDVAAAIYAAIFTLGALQFF